MKIKLTILLMSLLGATISAVNTDQRTMIYYYYNDLNHPSVMSRLEDFKQTQITYFAQEAGYAIGSQEYEALKERVTFFYTHFLTQPDMQLIVVHQELLYPMIAFFKIVDGGKTAQLFQGSCATEHLYKVMLLKIFYYTRVQKIQLQIPKDRMFRFENLKHILNPKEIENFYGDSNRSFAFELSRDQVMTAFADLIKFF